MYFKKTDNEIIVSANPFILRFVGFSIILFGVCLFVVGLLGAAAFVNSSPQTIGTAFALGLIAVIIGVFIIKDSPRTELFVDRTNKRVRLVRVFLHKRYEVIHQFSEITEFCRIQEKDSDGDPVWYFGVKFGSGEIVKLSAFKLAAVFGHDDYIHQCNEFLSA